MNKREYIEELKAALHAVRQERINRVRSRIHRLRVTTPAPGDIRDIMRLIQGAEALRRLIEDTILANAPGAVSETKQLIRDIGGLAVDDATAERLARGHAAKRQSAEANEGLTSFAEKRDAAWYPGKEKPGAER